MVGHSPTASWLCFALIPWLLLAVSCSHADSAPDGIEPYEQLRDAVPAGGEQLADVQLQEAPTQPSRHPGRLAREGAFPEELQQRSKQVSARAVGDCTLDRLVTLGSATG